MAPSLVWNSKLVQARYGSWSGRPVRMKSRPRRSHSYCEGVMMFQRGGSMRSFHPVFDLHFVIPWLAAVGGTPPASAGHQDPPGETGGSGSPDGGEPQFCLPAPSYGAFWGDAEVVSGFQD